jgi:uncharacterized membrane protein (DUF485 family)
MSTTHPGQGREGATPTETVYNTVSTSDDFQTLRRRYRGFAFPMTVAFMVWYLLFVLLSNYAHDFMSAKLVGNINVALVFGLLQFVSTFVIAWLYSRHATEQLDPIAERIRARVEGDQS